MIIVISFNSKVEDQKKFCNPHKKKTYGSANTPGVSSCDDAQPAPIVMGSLSCGQFASSPPQTPKHCGLLQFSSFPNVSAAADVGGINLVWTTPVNINDFETAFFKFGDRDAACVKMKKFSSIHCLRDRS